MATAIDKHLLKLLIELDDLCLRSGIRYSLANHSAWDAVKFGKYHGDMYETSVMFEESQFKLFKKLKLPENRAIVDFDKRGCKYKYVDTNAVLLDYRDNPNGFQPMPGVEITIVENLFGFFARLTKPDGSKVKVPKRLFRSFSRLAIEDHSFSVVENTDCYLTAIVGVLWKKRKWPYTVPYKDVAVVYIDNMKPELFLSQPIVKKSLTKRFRDLRSGYWRWYSGKYKPANKVYEQYKVYLTRTEDRFNLWEHYYPIKSDILAMSSEGHHDEELREVLDDLMSAMWRYKSKGLGFSIDEDLLQVCIPYLIERYGKKDVDELIALIPREYREVSIDELLTNNGVKHPLLIESDYGSEV